MEIVIIILIGLYIMSQTTSGLSDKKPIATGAYEIVKNWQALAQKYAAQNGIETEVVLAIIAVESGGDPNASGITGDNGLMQITDVALRDYNTAFGTGYTLAQLYDPEINIKIGVGFLKLVYSRVRPIGRIDGIYVAIRAYNVGLSRAETNGFEYQDKVLAWYKIFKNLNTVN
jgi:soluble lytic murein transglycosylase-like protein